MKHNEKLLFASICCGIVCILFGAVSCCIFYSHWPFFEYDVVNDQIQGCWIGRGGIMLGEILFSLVFIIVSFLLLFLSGKQKLTRAGMVWAGGMQLLTFAIMVISLLRYWEDVTGFVPLSSAVYFFGFVQGIILCFAKGEKEEEKAQ